MNIPLFGWHCLPMDLHDKETYYGNQYKNA